VRRVAVAVLLRAGLLSACSSGSDGAAAAATPDSRLKDADTALPACPQQPEGSAPAGELSDVALPCFTGGTVDFGRPQGVPTVVNLWASWCTPCREELPLFQQLATAAGDRLRVVGVVSKDGIGQGASFAQDAGITFPTAFDDDGHVMAGLGLRDLPHTVLIGADGSVAAVQITPFSSLQELESVVADKLGVQL
jgi:thiol-disulfide isomerase/thioredoxin